MRLSEKLTFKEDDSLITQATNTDKEEILKSFCPTKRDNQRQNVNVSQRLDKRISAILGTNESGLMSCQHYMKVVINKYKLSFISNQYQFLWSSQCGQLFLSAALSLTRSVLPGCSSKNDSNRQFQFQLISRK